MRLEPKQVTTKIQNVIKLPMISKHATKTLKSLFHDMLVNVELLQLRWTTKLVDLLVRANPYQHLETQN